MDRSNRGKLAVAALLVLANVVGCSDSTSSPSPISSARPSTQATATTSPMPSPAPTLRPAGRFVSTGSLNHARMNATAILLKTGKVLLVGGSPQAAVPYQPVLASAELYDPSTGVFTPTGSMRTARMNASATLLHDGRVLIAGGSGCLDARRCFLSGWFVGRDALASAELYDPATGAFTPTGSMSAPRTQPNATILPDGKVLMLNGGTAEAEIYDPASGKFSQDGSLSAAYQSSTATLLANGKVLVVGDWQTAELFDPATGKPTAVRVDLPAPPASITDPHTYSQIPETATPLKDGRALISFLSGFDESDISYPPYSESGLLATYDPATNLISQPLWIQAPPRWHTYSATLLVDGRVLLVGGYVGPTAANVVSLDASAVIYDPAGRVQLIDATLAAPRSDHTATLLPDGSVLIVGGSGGNAGDLALASSELFRP